jgi:hypothetical protein
MSLQVRQTSGLGQDTKLPGMGLPSGSRWVLACSNVMLGMYHVPMQTKGKQIQPLGHCHSTSLSEYPTKSGPVGAGCAKPFDLPAGGPP